MKKTFSGIVVMVNGFSFLKGSASCCCDCVCAKLTTDGSVVMTNTITGEGLVSYSKSDWELFTQNVEASLTTGNLTETPSFGVSMVDDKIVVVGFDGQGRVEHTKAEWDAFTKSVALGDFTLDNLSNFRALAA
jgi:hypothetical protein